MRKLFKERKLFKGGKYMRKYGTCFRHSTFLEMVKGIRFTLFVVQFIKN
jgi:hypothetical protein